ncbi:MAG: single-stranded-DNA-specific exonuclease RecJ [Patescibacteria group bacterium]
MKKIKILSELKKFDEEQLLKLLLENRGINSKKEIKEFLNPKLESLTVKNLGIDKKSLLRSLARIKTAIEKKERIIVFGDYDVDGITGTAVLWETLNSLSANAMPYIPHRVSEGYGLSKIGIENLIKQYEDVKLIITVDNGIVANEAVGFAKSKNIEVIITDHHVPDNKLPKAYSIVHSTKICGAAVAWFLSKRIKNQELGIKDGLIDDHLSLVALATVADVMPLNGFNRTLVKIGLENLKNTKRPGLLALLKSAGVDKKDIGVYEIGHIIGPRINAMGRLQHGMDSLRLICTRDPKRAIDLAQKLNLTNIKRQQLTFDSFAHAKNLVGEDVDKLIFISDKSYEPGVIGLIAGRLTENYYRPSIVLSVGKTYSKASARSVSGFNIVEFIRTFSDILVDVGGHPMAAGFTVETKNIEKLKKKMEKLAEGNINQKLLTRIVKVDCELSLSLINNNLFVLLNKLAPFGYGNPEPTFLASSVVIESMRSVGIEQKHLKVQLRSDLGLASSQGRTLNVGTIDGIIFNHDSSQDLKIGGKVDIVYTISENIWNGNKNLELKIKDIKSSN